LRKLEFSDSKTTATFESPLPPFQSLDNRLKATYALAEGQRVVCGFSRSIEMVICIFAVLKAGGQSVPVDGGIAPVEILAHQITDSGASIVLRLPKHPAKVEQSMLTAKARAWPLLLLTATTSYGRQEI
jgi:acyl-coenzyme A synthetase/AMP-(fatty) acid ligase